MTKNSGVPDIKYKKGVRDIVGFHLMQNGADIDLSVDGCEVTFDIRAITDPENFKSVPCILGGTVNGTHYSAEQGGISINFRNEDLDIADEYHGEIVVKIDGIDWFVCPSDDDVFVLMVYPRV